MDWLFNTILLAMLWYAVVLLATPRFSYFPDLSRSFQSTEARYLENSWNHADAADAYLKNSTSCKIKQCSNGQDGQKTPRHFETSARPWLPWLLDISSISSEGKMSKSPVKRLGVARILVPLIWTLAIPLVWFGWFVGHGLHMITWIHRASHLRDFRSPDSTFLYLSLRFAHFSTGFRSKDPTVWVPVVKCPFLSTCALLTLLAAVGTSLQPLERIPTMHGPLSVPVTSEVWLSTRWQQSESSESSESRNRLKISQDDTRWYKQLIHVNWDLHLVSSS